MFSYKRKNLIGVSRVMKMGTKHMEIQPEELKIEGVSFVGSFINKSQGLGCKEETFFSQKQLEIPRSPNHAMEFLCRSWSPSASDFLNIFSSRNILEPSDVNRVEEREDDTMNNISEKYTSTIKEDNIRTWPKGKSLTSFLRSRKEKKKEETRLRTSQLHAALSLTQLAAAIAGISRGKQDFTQIHKGKSVASGQDMGEVVASAAALVTAAFAETAESLGAQRAQVRAAVNSGMAIQNPIDMIEVTATAATYKVVSILEETGEHEEYSFLSVKTSNGVIKLLFKDKMQSRIWISTIFNLLEMQGPYCQKRHKDYYFRSSNTIV
ncbi:uncharacterized protein Fot_12444 [Forsythia ovata]|uniref:VAN3-binding protein-like auxin canalisation domain-containing protein n=1 Tax=Forsythia ovata TaxID=205694 RepID=A0ABD1WML0_9LAMI